MELESQKIQDMLHEYVLARYSNDYSVKFDLPQSFLEKEKRKSELLYNGAMNPMK